MKRPLTAFSEQPLGWIVVMGKIAVKALDFHILGGVSAQIRKAGGKKAHYFSCFSYLNPGNS
jgi:hypothetical protein